MRKRLICLFTVLSLVFSALALNACTDNWFDDAQSNNPDYHPIVSESGDENYASFLLEFRYASEETEREEWDAYPHSKTNGKLIKSWEIPVYGNTLYESIEKYFPKNGDDFSFRLSQHKFYMFHECTVDGTVYNLETVYVAADGAYANCANYQSLLGEDGNIGTDDDVKTVVLVYRGWLY